MCLELIVCLRKHSDITQQKFVCLYTFVFMITNIFRFLVLCEINALKIGVFNLNWFKLQNVSSFETYFHWTLKDGYTINFKATKVCNIDVIIKDPLIQSQTLRKL